VRPPVRRLLWKGLLRCFPVRARKRSVRATYDGLAARDRTLAFLNQGYLPLEGDDPPPVLAEADRPAQLHANLYDHVVGPVDLAGRTVLEVGCGQGAGSHYLEAYRGAARVTGLDLSPRNVAVATRLFARPGLAFREGDAEALPFPAASFDAVVNVESAHLYPRPEVFVREAHRVLRPGGHLLLADLGEGARLAGLGDAFRRAGFTVARSRDITRNVVAAIRASDEVRRALVRDLARDDRELTELVVWARLVGSPGYQAYLEGREQYWSYVLRKA
jgi:SAM-dependent methyltransferase